jgi:chaperonin GroEL
MREKKDRVEDALHATKAAIEEGIVPGGGMALLHARNGITDFNNIGSKIVYEVCSSPFKKILSNAGYVQEDIYNALAGATGGDNWWGFNLKDEDFCDMKEIGVIDPAKVTRTALQNAASVAGTILLTEAVVVDKPEDTKDDAGLGGMPEMY